MLNYIQNIKQLIKRQTKKNKGVRDITLDLFVSKDVYILHQ